MRYTNRSLAVIIGHIPRTKGLFRTNIRIIGHKQDDGTMCAECGCTMCGRDNLEKHMLRVHTAH